MERNRSPLTFALPLFAGVVLACAGLATSGLDWAGWRPATCMPDRCFCEPVGSGTVRQPINAWTNLAFCFAGCLAVGYGLRDRRNRAKAPLSPARSILFGAGAIAVGLGSFVYHSCLCFVGQWFDVFGMYLLALFVFWHALDALVELPAARFALGYAGFNVLGGIALVAVPVVRRELFGAMVVAALVAEGVAIVKRRRRARTGLLWAAVGSLGAGFLVWNLDLSGIWCRPESLLQGHAFWHLFDAVCVGLLYAYYRSDRGGEVG